MEDLWRPHISYRPDVAVITVLFAILPNVLTTAIGGHRKLKPIRNLTICAIVRDEMPYVLEWIEYYRLQGVDKFILYDDGSWDDTLQLQHFFASRGEPNLVEIVPANAERPSARSDPARRRYYDTQSYVLNHCNQRCARRSEWVMMVDVDEFIYSPLGVTLWEYIKSKHKATHIEPLSRALSEFFLVTPARYGTSGLNFTFRGQLLVDPYGVKSFTVKATGGGTLNDGLGDGKFPMITKSNPSRAPQPQMDTDYNERYNATCRDHKDSDRCEHALGKSIWKPERCNIAGVHWCLSGLQGRWQSPPVTELREYHYAFKARERVAGLIDLLRANKLKAFDNFDKSWFSSRYDPLPATIVEAVQNALHKYYT